MIVQAVELEFTLCHRETGTLRSEQFTRTAEDEYALPSRWNFRAFVLCKGS